MAATFFPQELFRWLRSGWFPASWCAVLTAKITRRRIDRWEAAQMPQMPFGVIRETVLGRVS